jgi:predicted MPP superfamily phosphohydrolase
MNASVRIVHISDLHISAASQADQERVISGALADLGARHEERPIDAVVFTGDLAHANKADEFDLAKRLLLDPLEEKLGLSRGQIVLLPGNHDVDLDAITEVSEAGLAAVLTTRDAVNNLLADDRELGMALARLQPWLDFRAEYYAETDTVQTVGALGCVHRVVTPEGTLGVAALNSSWRCLGGSRDRGKVLVGESEVEQAMAALRDVDLPIAAVHHPIDWLAGFDGDRARSLLESERIIVLTGHEHDPDPSYTASVRGRCIYDRGGCLYESHEYRNAFSILDHAIRDPDVTIAVREWYPSPRAEFAESTRLSDGGAVVLDLPSLSPIHHPHYSTVMDALADQALDRSVLLEPPPPDVAVRVADLVVPPAFYTIPHEQARATPSVRRNADALVVSDPASLLASAPVVIVCAENEDDGVTTSLIWLLARYYEKEDALLPVYLEDGKALGTNRADRALKAAAAEVGYSTDGRPLPPLLVAVDDADARPTRLAKHIVQAPEHRYILGAHGEGHAALAEALARQGVSAERVHVWPFKRSQVRALVNQIEGTDDDALVEQVSSLLISNRLPRSPFLIAALIAVLRSQGDLQILNESSILAAYARFILGATDLAESAEHGQDYRAREYLLGCLAEALLSKQRHRMTRAEAERFFSDYFAQHGHARSPVAVLQDLIERRILVEAGDEVGFRQSAFLYLFAGFHMNEIDHKDFKAEMLREPLRYAAVLRHAAGLGRNDRELLECASAALTSALAAVVESIQPDMFDRLFETEERREATLENLKEQLAVVITPPSADDDTHDQVHDIVLSAENAEEQEAKDLSPGMALLAALRLAGDVLKASEFVGDDNVKCATAKMIVSAHAVLGAATAGLENERHELRDSLLQMISSMEDRGEEVSDVEDVDHILRALLTALVLGAAATNLASPHLRGAVTSLQEDPELSASPGRALILATIAAILEFPGWTKGLTDLYERFAGFPYLRELIRDMTTNIYRSTPHEDAAGRLEEFLVGVYTVAGGDKSRTRTQLRRGRMKAQLMLQGIAPDDLEGAIDTVIADPDASMNS